MKSIIINKGITKTAFVESPNGKPKIINNEIKWDANYDGNLANISVNIDKNGKKKHIDMKLTNDDLSRLLSIPSVDKNIDKRLMNDFDNNIFNLDNLNDIERNLTFPISQPIYNNDYISEVIPQQKSLLIIKPLSLSKQSFENLKSKSKSLSKTKSLKKIKTVKSKSKSKLSNTKTKSLKTKTKSSNIKTIKSKSTL